MMAPTKIAPFVSSHFSPAVVHKNCPDWLDGVGAGMQRGGRGRRAGCLRRPRALDIIWTPGNNVKM
jgi:hypothetical protein